MKIRPIRFPSQTKLPKSPVKT